MMIKKESLQFAADLLITALQDAKDPTKQEFTQVSYRDDDTAYLLMNSGSVSIRIAHRGKDVAKIPESGAVQRLPFLDFFADPDNHKKLERQDNGCYVVKNPDEHSYAPCKNKDLSPGAFDLDDYMRNIRGLYVTQTTKLPAFDLEGMTRIALDGKALYLIRDDQTAVWKRISIDCGQRFHGLMPGMLAVAKKDEEGCFFGISSFKGLPILQLCWPNRNIDAAVALGYPRSLSEFTFYTDTHTYVLSGIQNCVYKTINQMERKEQNMAKSEMDASLQALQNLQSLQSLQCAKQQVKQSSAENQEPAQQQRQTFVSQNLAQQVASQVLPKQNIGNVPLQRQPLTQVQIEQAAAPSVQPASPEPVPVVSSETTSQPSAAFVATVKESIAHMASREGFSDAAAVPVEDSKEEERIMGEMSDLKISATAVHAPANIRTKRTKSVESAASVMTESEGTVSVSDKMQAVLDKSDSGEVQSIAELLDLLIQSIQNHLEISKTQLKMMKLIQKQYKMEQKNNPSWKEKYEELQATFNTLKSLFNGR